MNLKDKRVFVTGGARGIGRGIVTLLAKEGARVAFTYTSNPAPSEELLKELPGDGHLCVKMDVRDGASIQEGFAKAMETLGGHSTTVADFPP